MKLLFRSTRRSGLRSDRSRSQSTCAATNTNNSKRPPTTTRVACNAMRFSTTELNELEAKISRADGEALAREMARYDVTVNCVCPGPTDTPLMAAVPDKIKEAFARVTPMRRLAKPAEIADAILFFASPRAQFVTGQVLSVSGGLTMAG